MSNKISDLSNAAMIRNIGMEQGFNHSNSWFVEQLARPPYRRIVTPQQIQHTLGLLSQRRLLEPELTLHQSCKEFMQRCKYDVNLAKRLIRNVIQEEGVCLYA